MREIRNLHPDPRCLKARGTWRATVQQAGEKHRYTLADGQSVGAVGAWGPLSNTQLAGMVLYARFADMSQDAFENLGIEGSTLIVRGDDWYAVASGSTASNRTISVAQGPFTLCEVGVYSLEDWEKLYDAYQKGAITYPWVAGPRNATTAGEKGPWEL